MTYVRDMNSEELTAHMVRLQATPGWHNPLDDRLWQEVQSLRVELEAARGLLRQARPAVAYESDRGDEAGRQYRITMAGIDAFLAATPAPEVRPDLIRFDFINADGQQDSKMITHDEMRERYAALSEQGERQEAFIYALMRDGDPVVLDWASDEEVAKGWVSKGYHYLPLYTTPQPVPDVRPLVEAIAICEQEAAEWDSDAVVADKNYAAACAQRIHALAAHRQAQQGGSHDT